MENKTAMEQMISKLEFVIKMWKDPINEMDGLHTLETLKKEATYLLEVEKKNIVEAWSNGLNTNRGRGDTYFFSGSEYYSAKFNN